MTAPADVRDLGRLGYGRAHALMRDLVAERAAGRARDTLLLVEHDPVFTLGRRSREGNVLAPGDVPVVAVERGGDVTYHGPGQLVAYPVFALAEGERDAPRFIRRLEAWLIAALGALGVPDAERNPGFSGVWCRGRKLASVGVSVTAQWITWHGVALNVTTDLSYFHRINPCGLEATVMASLQSLTGAAPPMDAVKSSLVEAMPEHLGREAAVRATSDREPGD